MSLIESNVRGDGRSRHNLYGCSTAVVPSEGQRSRGAVTVMISPAVDLTAAELASIESERTREKIKLKEKTVAKFHQKVIRRLATEKRAAGARARGGGAKQPSTGPVDSFADLGPLRQSSEFASKKESRALWAYASPSNEVSCYQSVKVIGVRGHMSSLSDADTDARYALATYRR
ncbi:unnamed protein product [Scytosiphon promiscuus]